LAALIAALFAQHRGTYGAPRITADLTEMGWRVSQNTVAALLVEQGLRARATRRRRGTTRPGKGRWHAPDLVKRDFTARRVNQRWFGDGTEIDTAEGKLQLASVLDVCSRRILGFALSEHHDAELAYGSLAMAVAVRGEQIAGVVLHTDRGSEYTATLFRGACARLGIAQSMGRPGSALDNAVIESWHSTLEFELRSCEKFPIKATARRRVAAWIDEYNRSRRHSSIGMISPIDYELAIRTIPIPRTPTPRWPDRHAHRPAQPPRRRLRRRCPSPRRAGYGAAPPASRVADAIATATPSGRP
jgi:transposase InsO family protein